MILVTGGRSQGKRNFVETQLCGGKTVCWVDGATAGTEEMEAAEYCFNFQTYLRRMLGGEFQAGAEPWPASAIHTAPDQHTAPDHQTAPDLKIVPEALVRRFLAAKPGRVIVTDEIGGGIVPISGEERHWREETGRICCCVAALSEQVWRVVCGIGLRIK